MRKVNLLSAFVVLTGFAFAIWQMLQPSIAKAKPTATMKSAHIKKGMYLVNLGGCNDCHSAKVFTSMGPMPDTTRLLAGHMANGKLPQVNAAMIGPDKWGGFFNNDLTAWVGPWGVSFTANLTPDEATGIGMWTEEVFIKAMRTGKHMGAGRPILPPMPWQNYGQLNDEDLGAIFAYLKSIRPVKNAVPQPIAPTDLASQRAK